MSQFELFPTEILAEPSCAWILACPDDDATKFISLISTCRHLIVDSRTGQSTVKPSDLILVRNQETKKFTVFYPTNPTYDAPQLFELAADVLPRMQAEADDVENMVAIFLKAPGLESKRPPREATGFEKFLATVRHKTLNNMPSVRLLRSTVARTAMANSAEVGVLAILDREVADAARSAYTGHADMAQKQFTKRVHDRAKAEFLASGLSGHAAKLTSLFADWTKAEQPYFPLFQDLAAQSPASFERMSYRSIRLVGRRTIIPNVGMARSATSGVSCRRQSIEAELPDAQICHLLNMANSSRLRPWFKWLTDNNKARRATLETGLDTDLSVLLGIAGRTGIKRGSYTLRVHNWGCRVQPEYGPARIGSPQTLQICDVDWDEFQLNLEFVTSAGSRIVTNVTQCRP